MGLRVPLRRVPQVAPDNLNNGTPAPGALFLAAATVGAGTQSRNKRRNQRHDAGAGNWTGPRPSFRSITANSTRVASGSTVTWRYPEGSIRNAQAAGLLKPQQTKNESH
jgi:hypothetical protein